MWHARNLCIKTICILYRSPENKIYLASNGAFEYILDLIEAKPSDLQEATMVAILSLISHPQAPYIFLDMSGVERVVILLESENEVVRELTVVLLKALALYDAKRVKEAVSTDLAHLLESDDIPMRYGGEYVRFIICKLFII